MNVRVTASGSSQSKSMDATRRSFSILPTLRWAMSAAPTSTSATSSARSFWRLWKSVNVLKLLLMAFQCSFKASLTTQASHLIRPMTWKPSHCRPVWDRKGRDDSLTPTLTLYSWPMTTSTSFGRISGAWRNFISIPSLRRKASKESARKSTFARETFYMKTTKSGDRNGGENYFRFFA